MKLKIAIWLLLCVIFTISCYTVERKYYFSEATIKKIKAIEKDRNYTFIDYNLPAPDKERVREYMETDLEYTFKKSSFKKNKTTFALVGRSTMNFGKLYRVDSEDTITLDSFASRYKEFIFLNLDPIEKGDYRIESHGCRYHKEIRIKIK